MKQLFLDPKAGSTKVVNLPEPALRPGTLLVRNACSVISPGTERNALRLARGSYLSTARARPDLVRRVVDTVRREGVLAAYRKVQSRMSQLQALGYSCAGTVTTVGEGAGGYFREGDRVACAGAGHASHGEVVCVPMNLAARIPEEVPFEAAAFATLGAIALHGVRQSEPALGERFAVIGLGVMGLLTVQLLRAAGARVIAFDLQPELAERALRLGTESASAGPVDDQVAAALDWTEGVGVDGVIVAAAATSDDPMTAAAGMCRDRGRVTALGLVPFSLPREIAYEKELDLRIARSCGPGRYDPRFEESGFDYPIGYVRWTETRNLEAFLQLVAEKKVTPLALITHRFGIEEATRACELLLSGATPHPLGILISYPEGVPLPLPRKSPAQAVIPLPRPPVARAVRDGQVRIGFIGAGAFARSTLLPLLKRQPAVRLCSVITAHGMTALEAQRRFGFERVGTDVEALISDPEVPLIFIATRHDLHASLVVRALQAGKHVFVEKPLALNEDQLRQVEEAAGNSPGMLMVGFNRRFSPHATAIRQAFRGRSSLMMSYRVSAEPLVAGHWLSDPARGGGRIIGEMCHFIDLLSFLTGDEAIVSVQARTIGRSRGPAEDVAALLSFSDGSLGQILYTVRGSQLIGKEWLEVHAGGASAVLKEFRVCRLSRGRRMVRFRGSGKGHLEELAVLLDAVRKGGPAPIPLEVLSRVTRATFSVQAALSHAPTA